MIECDSTLTHPFYDEKFQFLQHLFLPSSANNMIYMFYNGTYLHLVELIDIKLRFVSILTQLVVTENN